MDDLEERERLWLKEMEETKSQDEILTHLSELMYSEKSVEKEFRLLLKILPVQLVINSYTLLNWLISIDIHPSIAYAAISVSDSIIPYYITVPKNYYKLLKLNWSYICNPFQWQVSIKSVRKYGSLLQDAVAEKKTPFVRILLEYGYMQQP